MKIKKISRVSGLMVLIFAGFSSHVSAQTAAISFNNNSAQLSYGFLVGGTTYGRMELRTDFLYSKDETYLLSPGILLTDDVGSGIQGLKAGLGGKLYGASVRDTARDESSKFLALGIGGMLRYALPINPRVFVSANFYYSPNILSFDADKFYDGSLNIGFEVLPTASVFLEYRRYFLDTEKDSVAFNDGTVAFETGVRFGMELNF